MIHSKDVIHCDIQVSKLLLDIEVNIKLCDFQARRLGSNGQLKSDGGSSENPKFFMPRDDPTCADIIRTFSKTSIFFTYDKIARLLTSQKCEQFVQLTIPTLKDILVSLMLGMTPDS